MCACVLFGLPAAHAQQTASIEWQDAESFTKADRSAIPALAKVMGIQNPRRVAQGVSIPIPCPYAFVESGYFEDGHLRTYLQLALHRKDWKCMRGPAGEQPQRVGRWSAYATEIETRREWKIEDQGWVQFVPFEDGVPYEDAALIVLTIKHRQLVNRLPRADALSQLPSIDVGEITSIRVKANDAKAFEVWTSIGGAGDVYVVKINGSTVELHEIGVWMA